MNLEQALKVIRDAINYIEAQGMFVNGTVNFANLNTDAGLVAAIEQSLKKNGLEIPGKVDSIISMIPLLMGVIK